MMKNIRLIIRISALLIAVAIGLVGGTQAVSAGIFDELGLNKCNFAGQSFGVNTECNANCTGSQVNISELRQFVPVEYHGEFATLCETATNVCCADKGDALCSKAAERVGATASCKEECGTDEQDVTGLFSGVSIPNPCTTGDCCVVGAVGQPVALPAPTGAGAAAAEGTQVTEEKKPGKGKTTVGYGLRNPLGSRTVPQIIGAIIGWASGLAGALFMLYLIWGGIEWMTAAGSPDRLKSGQKKILYAIFGIVIVVLSYFLVDAIIGLTNIPPGT
jgi:hypothetical protein